MKQLLSSLVLLTLIAFVTVSCTEHIETPLYYSLSNYIAFAIPNHSGGVQGYI